MDSELMRQFLIVICQGKPGGEIKFHLGTLDGVNPNARLEFYRDGPLMALRVAVVQDRWGRVVDRAGQVKCLECEVRVNYGYPDGSKRTHCAVHESTERRTDA